MIERAGGVGMSIPATGRRRRRRRINRSDGAAKYDQLDLVLGGGNDLLHVLEGFPDEVYSVPFQNLAGGRRDRKKRMSS